MTCLSKGRPLGSKQAAKIKPIDKGVVTPTIFVVTV
jgi:hypothetical protein